jgi:hypothetical protein
MISEEPDGAQEEHAKHVSPPRTKPSERGMTRHADIPVANPKDPTRVGNALADKAQQRFIPKEVGKQRLYYLKQ